MDYNIHLSKKTVFPFDFFPTVVDVTENHVIITYRQLFWTSQQQVIPIKDLHNIEIDFDLWFGSLILIYGFEERKIIIPKFWKKDAKELELAIQTILDGK